MTGNKVTGFSGSVIVWGLRICILKQCFQFCGSVINQIAVVLVSRELEGHCGVGFEKLCRQDRVPGVLVLAVLRGSDMEL